MATYNKNTAKKSTANASIISDIRVYLYESDKSNTKAFVSVTIGGVFTISNITVVEGKKGLFVSMPQRLMGKGRKAEYKDICFPVTKDFREELYTKILDAYEEEVSEVTRRMTDENDLPF